MPLASFLKSRSSGWSLALSVCIILALILASFVSFASAGRITNQAVQRMPDARSGVLFGKVAILALPVSDNGYGTTRLLGAAGCKVHMADSDNVEVVREYPCGAWFQPPVGRYLFWLERGSSISYQTIIYFAGEKFTTAGKVFLKPVYPAGSVQLDLKTTLPADGTLRLLALDTRARYRPFDRRISATHAKEPVRLPVGRVIASIFDRSGRALSLSRPLSVTKGSTTAIVPDFSDIQGATVLAILNRFVSHKLPTCNGTLLTPTERLRPDIDMQAYDRIVFAWYAVRTVGMDNSRFDAAPRIF